MISSALLNLIVSIVAVGLFVAILRVAHLAAGGQFERTPAKPQGDTPWKFVAKTEGQVLSGERASTRSAPGLSQHFFTDANPGLRIGDGDNCCVQGGPQDRWGMFSFPLFERIKAETPEFEQLTAFQAGGFRASVRRCMPSRLAVSEMLKSVSINV